MTVEMSRFLLNIHIRKTQRQLPSLITRFKTLYYTEFNNTTGVRPLLWCLYLHFPKLIWPVTVAERSKTCNVFARSEAEIVGSNHTQDMDVWCVCAFFCVCVVLCLSRELATSWSPSKGSYRLSKIKWLQWNEAIHGCPMLHAGATEIDWTDRQTDR
jgi:hypothetical protein